MKQIEVKIMQQSYVLGCPEGHESRLLSAVERVDGAMSRIRDAGKVRARERIAVLAALNLAFEIADQQEVERQKLLAEPAPEFFAPAPAVAQAIDPEQEQMLQQAHEVLQAQEHNERRLLSLLARLDAALDPQVNSNHSAEVDLAATASKNPALAVQ